MTASTELASTPGVYPKAQPESPPIISANETGPAVYWGDRLSLIFWLFCFGLMFAMHLFEALHQLVLLLLGRSPTP